jgi:hypothetical protein
MAQFKIPSVRADQIPWIYRAIILQDIKAYTYSSSPLPFLIYIPPRNLVPTQLISVVTKSLR